MRSDPERLRFEIDARDGAARTGRLHTRHGPVETPGLHPAGDPRQRSARSTLAEVAELGYELVLGNTFHLLLSPGRRADRRARRPAPVHGLGAGDHHRLRRLPGLLARPRQRRRRDQGPARRRRAERRACSRSPSRGCASAPTSTARERFLGPGGVDGGPGGARLRHRPRLRRVHALPRRPRLHRALDRAHPPLARPLPRLARASTGPRAPGGVRDRPGRRPRGPAPRRRPSACRAAAVDGLAIGGTLGRDKEEMHGVLGDDRAACCRPRRRKHLLGIGEPDDLLDGDRARHRPLRLRRADPPRPPRDGAGPAARSRAFGSTSAKRRVRRRRGAAGRGLPVRGLRRATPAPTSTTSRAPRS